MRGDFSQVSSQNSKQNWPKSAALFDVETEKVICISYLKEVLSYLVFSFFSTVHSQSVQFLKTWHDANLRYSSGVRPP